MIRGLPLGALGLLVRFNFLSLSSYLLSLPQIYLNHFKAKFALQYYGHLVRKAVEVRDVLLQPVHRWVPNLEHNGEHSLHEVSSRFHSLVHNY